MRISEVRCDNCNADLSSVHSGYEVYGLQLSAHKIHNTSDFRYAVIQSPPIKNDMDFCSTKCLKEYFE